MGLGWTAALKRPHVDIGTEIAIPNNKLKWDRDNPTPTRHRIPGPLRLRLLLRSTRGNLIAVPLRWAAHELLIGQNPVPLPGRLDDINS